MEYLSKINSSSNVNLKAAYWFDAVEFLSHKHLPEQQNEVSRVTHPQRRNQERCLQTSMSLSLLLDMADQTFICELECPKYGDKLYFGSLLITETSSLILGVSSP